GENRQDRQLVVVVPKEERIVPKEDEAECGDDEARAERTEIMRALQAFHRNALQNNRRSLSEQENFVADAILARSRHQARGRFVERFIAEPETAVVHRNEKLRA